MRTLTQPGAPLQPRRLLEWAAPVADLRVALADTPLFCVA